MPSKDPVRRFEDILANLERIEFHTARINDETAFEESVTIYDAVERCPKRICEAAAKLGPDAEALCPEIHWPRIRALGNVLRHEYDLVDGARIWYTVKDDLPPLKAATQRALQTLRDNSA